MGINSFSPDFLRTPSGAFFLAPLHALISFFMPVQNAAVHSSLCTNLAANRPARPRAIDKAAWRMHSGDLRQLPALHKHAVPGRLKIVRELEPGAGASCAGRMFISGRMADVCAELDRMVQQDAQSVPH